MLLPLGDPTIAVEPGLENHCGSDLVDHLTSLTGSHTCLLKTSGRLHGAESFVDKLHS
jgi:hypothetical protein